MYFVHISPSQSSKIESLFIFLSSKDIYSLVYINKDRCALKIQRKKERNYRKTIDGQLKVHSFILALAYAQLNRFVHRPFSRLLAFTTIIIDKVSGGSNY